MGDFNAHDTSWFSAKEDARATKLPDEISSTNLGVLSEDSPTRFPQNRRPTSPNITLASASTMPTAFWSFLN